MPQPIGVFDSGLGGLTVVRHLARHLPQEDIVYLGDTARVPYGSKSPETIRRFSRENASFLLRFDPKLIVVACNTASAIALSDLREAFDISFCGVIVPGAAAALEASRRKIIGVIGTEATILSGAYQRALEELDPSAKVFGRACPLLVPVVEEGRNPSDPIVRAVLAEYLLEMKEKEVDVIIMGCTHYPLLQEAVAAEMGRGVRIIDSGDATAREVRRVLANRGQLRPGREPGSLRSYISDKPMRFAQIGERFLGRRLEDLQVVTWEDMNLASNKPA